jgi:DMSO/TMAO reductase YedYZ molybdopterin-dependent catalytic subunit
MGIRLSKGARLGLLVSAGILAIGVASVLVRTGAPQRFCAPPDLNGEGPAALHVTGSTPSERIADAEGYRLRVWGKVEREMSLTLDEVRALPAVEIEAPLNCVVGWTDKGLWRGVPLRDLIQLARPTAEGTHVLFGDDGDFSSSLSLEYVLAGKPILAYELNGQELPRIHGWPLRVVAPDKWGYKWVKWVTEIEITDRGYEGNYERMGFSLDGDADGPRTEAERRGL